MKCPVCGALAQSGWEKFNSWSGEKTGTERSGFIEVGQYDTEEYPKQYEIEGDVGLFTCQECGTEFAIRT